MFRLSDKHADRSLVFTLIKKMKIPSCYYFSNIEIHGALPPIALVPADGKMKPRRGSFNFWPKLISSVHAFACGESRPAWQPGCEADAEAYDHRRVGRFFLSGQHESGRSARQVAVILQHCIGLVHFHRIGVEMELQADTVKNLFAAGVNQAIISLAQVGNRRLGFKLGLSEFPREAPPPGGGSQAAGLVSIARAHSCAWERSKPGSRTYNRQHRSSLTIGL